MISILTRLLAGGRSGAACPQLRPLLRLLLCGLLQMAAAGAWAHASLIDTAPPDGAMLRSAPSDLTLHFNEAVAPLVFKLALPDGSVQPVTQTATIENGLKLVLPAVKGDGTYLLSWRVVSADGHPVGGSLTYSIGARTGVNAAEAMVSDEASSMPPSLMAAIWTVRLALYLMLFAGVGAACFRAFVQSGPSAEAPSLWPAWVSLFVLPLLILAVGLQGLDALALPWQGLATGAPWKASLATAYGRTVLLMAFAAIAACVGSSTFDKTLRQVGAVLALLSLGAALAASGHASSALPQWLARPAVFAHAIAIALWTGSLVPLLLLLRARAEAGPGNVATAALLRFSRLIPWVLALLLISGAVLAYLQLDGIASLWRTDYGRILGAKLTLVALLLIVAAVNRYALTGRIQSDAGESRARVWMRRSICVELGLVLLILALATTWRFTPPPRASAAAHHAPVDIHIHGEKAMVDLSLKPQPDRRLRAALFVQGGDFSPLDAKEVSVEFSNPALGIEPLQKDAKRSGDVGNWSLDPFALPAPGRWHVRIDVLISDFETTALEQDVNIAF